MAQHDDGSLRKDETMKRLADTMNPMHERLRDIVDARCRPSVFDSVIRRVVSPIDDGDGFIELLIDRIPSVMKQRRRTRNA